MKFDHDANEALHTTAYAKTGNTFHVERRVRERRQSKKRIDWVNVALAVGIVGTILTVLVCIAMLRHPALGG